jgi:hypothetical protein
MARGSGLAQGGAPATCGDAGVSRAARVVIRHAAMRKLVSLVLCGVVLAAAAVGCSSSNNSGNGGWAGGLGDECRADVECVTSDAVQARCIFDDVCFGATYCQGSIQHACSTDGDCTGDTYCHLCSPGSGVCQPKCDGGDCADPPPQFTTCTKDSDCPHYCFNGFCGDHLGTCNSCI